MLAFNTGYTLQDVWGQPRVRLQGAHHALKGAVRIYSKAAAVRYDIPLDIGLTRHGITRGQAIYFFNPSGNRNAVFAGGFIYYPDNPKRVWSIDKIGKAVFILSAGIERALYERRYVMPGPGLTRDHAIVSPKSGSILEARMVTG
jgi:hypothetical protein